MNSQTFRSGVSVEMTNASNMARRALFAAASRVIRYHQAALDAKVSRLMNTETQRSTHREQVTEVA